MNKYFKQNTISLRVGNGVIPVFLRLGGGTGTGTESLLLGGNGGFTSDCMTIIYRNDIHKTFTKKLNLNSLFHLSNVRISFWMPMKHFIA